MVGVAGRSGRRKPVKPNQLQEAMPDLTAPAWLTAEGVELFHATARLIHEARLPLGQSDVPALAAYVEAWLDFIDAERVLAENGREIFGVDQLGNQTIKRNPAATRKREAFDRIKQGWTRFGLTPADRRGMKLPEAPKEPAAGFSRFVG